MMSLRKTTIPGEAEQNIVCLLFLIEVELIYNVSGI